jgi:DNA-binding GntR family transcriptional regulator
VSVTPVREALRILAADGTISYLPHRGATVRDIEPEMAADLYRLRAAVEGLATRIAVERMAPGRLDLITEAHLRIRSAREGRAEPAELSRLNKNLHFTIYRGGSALLLENITSLWSRFPVSVTIWGCAHNAGALEEDHEHILSAIRAGDAERAGDLMSEHIQHASKLRAAGATPQPPVGDSTARTASG